MVILTIDTRDTYLNQVHDLEMEMYELKVLAYMHVPFARLPIGGATVSLRTYMPRNGKSGNIYRFNH